MVRIEGHADEPGDDTHNLMLSRHRARSVGRYLVRSGVPVARRDVYGCGRRYPLTSGRDETSRRQNRRVQFEVVASSWA